MSVLHLEHIGPIAKARLAFGDLTLLVGPQASGKSIALQWLKLALDRGAIQSELAEYGLDWGRDPGAFLDLYFGEGMRGLHVPGKSSAAWGSRLLDPAQLAARKGRAKSQELFLVPAQRVLALRDGWPRPFGDYSAGDPFVVRSFSEQLRRIMEQEFRVGEPLFPKPNRLAVEFREQIAHSLFGGFSLEIARDRSQKRIILRDEAARSELPFMVWSAGQREFVPLLLGLYWLMPAAKVSRRNGLKWVVIEEPEMGLHPRAITTVLLLVLDLISRGYRVCLSTHSTQVLELAWGIQLLQQHPAAADDVLDLLGAPHKPRLRKVAEAALQHRVRAYSFDPGGEVRDITGLDPAADDALQASWGGLVDSSSRVNDVVARVVANANGRRRR